MGGVLNVDGTLKARLEMGGDGVDISPVAFDFVVAEEDFIGDDPVVADKLEGIEGAVGVVAGEGGGICGDVGEGVFGGEPAEGVRVAFRVAMLEEVESALLLVLDKAILIGVADAGVADDVVVRIVDIVLPSVGDETAIGDPARERDVGMLQPSRERLGRR